MESEELVERYISAWNRRDADGVLALMHTGAAYYDAFWRETCVGRDLTEYFHISFAEEAYSYQQAGEAIITDSGAIVRYNAHEWTDSGPGKVVFSGAEVLAVQDGKILTVSDFYCNPDREALLQLASLESERHGQPKYAASGLSAIRYLRIKRKLSELMNQDEFCLNPMLTDTQLADRIGCSVEQLFQVMSVESQAEYYEVLEQHIARHATDSNR